MAHLRLAPRITPSSDTRTAAACRTVAVVGALLAMLPAQVVESPPATPANSAKPTARLPLVIGRPAPDVGIGDWLGAKPGLKAIGSVLKFGDLELPEDAPDLGQQLEQRLQDGLAQADKVLNADAKQPGDLAQHHQKVVLVHFLDWTQPQLGEDLIELVREVLQANADREVRAIGITATDAAAADRVREAGIDWPIGLTPVPQSPSPYVDPTKDEPMALIGRSGQLCWRGNPVTNRQGFLQALEDALPQIAAERIERDLAAPLTAALEAYYDGALAKAIVEAERAQGRPEADEQLRRDAAHLIERASASELRWLRAMRDTSTRRREFDSYVRHVEALREAFPKSSGKEAAAHEKELAKRGDNALRLRGERKLFELQRQRSALFPARQNRINDAFAKKLEQLLSDKRISDEPRQRAQDLIDRYRSAVR